MEQLNTVANSAAQSGEVRFIKLKEVVAMCGKPRSGIYDAIKKGEFPAPMKVGGRASAWIKSEVLQWTQACIQASRTAPLPAQSLQVKDEASMI
jgi:prophage regulatory protein